MQFADVCSVKVRLIRAGPCPQPEKSLQEILGRYIELFRLDALTDTAEKSRVY